VANIRGKLYSVVDFPAFLGGGAVALGEQARLLLLSERFRMSGALLVDRSLGLRSLEQLQAREKGAESPPWVKAEYGDAGGVRWKDLDVLALVRHPEFLAVGA
jgi:twitching motility protein PilI